jgi:ribonuclease HI
LDERTGHEDLASDRQALEQARDMASLTPEEQESLAEAMGDATIRWIKGHTPSDAHKWVDRFAEEAQAAVKANPLGTSSLEKMDCGEVAHWRK